LDTTHHRYNIDRLQENGLCIALKIINKKFPHNKIINVSDIKHDDVLSEAIMKYIAYMEDIAVGINTGVYDIYIYDRMVGAQTINNFDKLIEIISFLRHEFDSRGNQKTYLYADFESLVTKLREVRGKRFFRLERDFAKMKHDLIDKR